MARRILFVCTGNICRSPMAEGLLRHLLTNAGLAAAVHVDSAGTHATEGEAPDPIAMDLMAARGIDISGLRARRFLLQDFERHDLIVAMDRGNLSHLRFLCPAENAHKVRIITAYARSGRYDEVADPYRMRRSAFKRALAVIEDGCNGLLAAVRWPLPWN